MVKKTGHMFEHKNYKNSEDSFSQTSVLRLEDDASGDESNTSI